MARELTKKRPRRHSPTGERCEPGAHLGVGRGAGAPAVARASDPGPVGRLPLLAVDHERCDSTRSRRALNEDKMAGTDIAPPGAVEAALAAIELGDRFTFTRTFTDADASLF